MSGFTKLVPEIVDSSIWNESAEIRCVWIAMLATKDANGYVRGDARSIARKANVSVDAASEALGLFQKPDPSSHTPDNEGRRIMPAPGGWIVLNHEIYRARDDIYRAKTRERVRRHREKMSSSESDETLPETLPKRDPSASASASGSASGSGEGESEGKDEPDPPRTVSRCELPAYGEFKHVHLSDEEHAKLTTIHGCDMLKQGISLLDDYMESKGKRYKNHYAVLKETGWVWKRLKETGSKPGGERAASPSMYELKAMLEVKEVEWEQCKTSNRADSDAGRQLKRRVQELKRQIGAYYD